MEIDGIFLHSFLVLLRFLLSILNFLTDTLLGYSITHGTKQERIAAEANYESSAHLVKVLWRAKQTMFSFTFLEDFFYTHVKYVSPSYILENKHVTLMDIEKDFAVFCVTDPNVDINRTEDFPFTFISQFVKAKQLIILPTKSFHRLADELGDPNVPVALVHMTARSGSTLLAQMMSRVPKTRVFAENWATCKVAGLRHQGKVTSEESKRLLQSGMRLHCKVFPGEEVERCFFKLTIPNAPQFKDFYELFPKFIYVFNSRHPISSMKSYNQAFTTVAKTLDYKIGGYWRSTVVAHNSFLPFDDNAYKSIIRQHNTLMPTVNVKSLGTIFYGAALVCYWNHKEIYDCSIFYEDLSENPEKEMEKIFKLMNIDVDLIPTALTALRKDSQNQLFGARGEGRSYNLPTDMLEYFDGYMKQLGLPITHGMSVEEFKNVLARTT